MTQFTCSNSHEWQASSTDDGRDCPICGAPGKGPIEGEVRLDDQHKLGPAELTEAVHKALDDLSHLSDPASREAFADELNLQLMSHSCAGPIRKACSIDRKIAIYFPPEDDLKLPLDLELALDIAEAIKATGEMYDPGWPTRGRLESFWEVAVRQLELGKALFRLAPSKYRRQVITDYLRVFQLLEPEPDAIKHELTELSSEELSLVPDLLFLGAGGQGVRERLPAERRVNLCQKDPDNLSLLEETARALGAMPADLGIVRRFWDIAQSRTEYDTPLFLLAPIEVKAEVLQEHLDGLPSDRAAEVLTAELERCEERDKRTLLEAAPLEYLRRVDWATFRGLLPLDQRVALCRGGDPSWLLEETALAVAGSDQQDLFWAIAGNDVGYPSRLFDLAPFSIKLEWLKEYLPAQPSTASLAILSMEVGKLPSAEDQRCLVRVAPPAVLLLPDAGSLRRKLTGPERIDLCEQASPNALLIHETAEDITIEKGFPVELVRRFWQTAVRYARYECPLFRLAPVETKAKILSDHFQNGPPLRYLDALRKELGYLSNADKPRLLESVCLDQLLEPEAKDLRRWLPFPRLLELCGRAAHSQWLHQEVAELVASDPWGETSPTERDWKTVEGCLLYRSPLYLRAPPRSQRIAVRRHFKKFFDAVHGATEIPLFDREWPASEVLSWLTAEDRKLAESWAMKEEGEPDRHLARMLSARAAEKVALAFYRQFSLAVADVSITQPKSSTGDWKQFDLWAGRRPIDVKNARVPVNNRQTYVDHCVPRYKQDRSRQDVTIAAVVSPWIKLDQFERPSSLWSDVVPFRFLGEADRNTDEQLQRSFVDWIARASTTITPVPVRHDGSRLLPPWLFDYPDFIYKRRDDSRAWLCGASDEQLPQLEDLRLTDFNPVPAFLGARQPLPPSWCPLLSPWQRRFYERVQQHREAFSLPALYLHLLLHFLEAIRSTAAPPDYSPEGYRKLLYPDPADRKTPVGIVDPLSIIDNLLEALNILWVNRHVTHLQDFQSFRFRGEGILSGIRKGTSTEVRILAYCGGKVPDRKDCKCGYSPLIVRQEETCNKCGFLICPKCRSCKVGCPANAKRPGGAVGHRPR